jgi:hypothetical protein
MATSCGAIKNVLCIFPPSPSSDAGRKEAERLRAPIFSHFNAHTSLSTHFAYARRLGKFMRRQRQRSPINVSDTLRHGSPDRRKKHFSIMMDMQKAGRPNSQRRTPLPKRRSIFNLQAGQEELSSGPSGRDHKTNQLRRKLSANLPRSLVRDQTFRPETGQKIQI